MQWEFYFLFNWMKVVTSSIAHLETKALVRVVEIPVVDHDWEYYSSRAKRWNR